LVHGSSDDTILIHPSAASQQAGVFLLLVGNLPVLLPVALFVLYSSSMHWQDVAIIGGAGLAWLVLATVWQAGNQPWTIHADPKTVWTTRPIWGRQTVPRGALDAIVAGAARYTYVKANSSVEPTYSFVGRGGEILAIVKARDYSSATFQELARYLNVPLKADLDRPSA
jgi:hypothetical protein